MNQTKKRLSIINFAISMTDIETIQLQIAKLTHLKTDREIQVIIKELQEGHYGKAQELIDTYINTPMEVILEKNTKEAKRIKEAQESAIISEFDLFVTGTKEEHPSIEEEALFLDTPQPSKKPANFDALLSIQPDDILTENITIEKTQTQTTEEPAQPTTPPTKPEPESLQEQEKVAEEPTVEAKRSETPSAPTITTRPQTPPAQEEPTEQPPTPHEEQEEETPAEAEAEQTPPEEEKPLQYPSIPHIEEKFNAMLTQYPLVHQSGESFSTVKKWLFQIMHGGYNSKKIDEIITYIQKLTEHHKYEEAAQLLLVTGATESKFAQFILARELYKGELLQRNLPESFALIYSLAMNDNYPEAICDLAQFYEYGIGVEKEKEEAERLYKEAMELGVSRATQKYEKLKKQNRGFFSAFRRS